MCDEGWIPGGMCVMNEYLMLFVMEKVNTSKGDHTNPQLSLKSRAADVYGVVHQAYETILRV